MSNKIEIDTSTGSIKLNDVEIGQTVAEWSFSFSDRNLRSSGNRSAFAMVFVRFVYDGDKMLCDDSGLMTYSQVFNDVDVSIKADGKIRKVLQPPIGMNVKQLKGPQNRRN